MGQLLAQETADREGMEGSVSVRGSTGCWGHGEPGRTKDTSLSLTRLWFSKHV